jgi:hypothetical protein
LESDVRKLFRPGNRLKNPDEWDDGTAATVASIKMVEKFEGGFAERKLCG